MLCKMDGWFPPSENLVFFKGHFFDSVAFPLNSSTKGQTTQCEALTERRGREWQGSVMGGRPRCAAERGWWQTSVIPFCVRFCWERSSVGTAASVSTGAQHLHQPLQASKRVFYSVCVRVRMCVRAWAGTYGVCVPCLRQEVLATWK